MKKVNAEVNGKKFEKEIPDHTLLSVFLRDILNLTGTHVGCDTSQCGACVVLVDGKSIKSCTAFAADVNGSKITTIEGWQKMEKCILCKRHLKNFMDYNVVFVLQEWL